MTQELAGKVAIVTGGANGIGRGAVELFVEHGAKVVIADIDEVAGSDLAARLGRSVRFRSTDVSKREDVQALVDFTLAQFGGLGIVHFTKSAAVELGEFLVRVNCICPANIQTQMGTFAAVEPDMTDEQAAHMKSAIERIRMSRQPLKRQGHVRDIVHTAMFLAGDRSVYITGQVVAVDGGASAGDARSQIGEIMEARVAARMLHQT